MKPKSIAAADGQRNVTKSQRNRDRNRETETETGIGIAIDVGRGLQMEMGIQWGKGEGANEVQFGGLTCACWAAAARSVHRP